MNIPFGRPIFDSSEFEALTVVMDSGRLVHGKVIDQFELDFGSYVGSPFAIASSSCTAGLHMAWLALGLGPGDDVLVSSQTHVASAHSISLVGARPIFIDSEALTGNLDLDILESRITPSTKAILIVHYLGTPVDMARVMSIASHHGLKVVEDCALALGATLDGRHVGTFGDFGVFSFYPVKHITSGEGGMVITQNIEHARKIKSLRAFGYEAKDENERASGIYDVSELGMNYRMSELHAAIGLVQLKKFRGFLEARRLNYQYYRSNFEPLAELGWSFLDQPNSSKFMSSHYAFVAVFNGRSDLSQRHIREDLANRGIGTSVYYPHPVPLLKYYRTAYGEAPQNFPNSSRISYRSIALPTAPHVGKAEIEFICDSLTVVSRASKQRGQHG